MPFTTPTTRWRALTTRNATADPHFVYAVKSTLIYCRPSCPARLARRANVDFYDTGAAAVAAGFRACKRCRPDEQTRHDPQGIAIGKACEIIVESVADGGNVGLKELARQVGLTPGYLHRAFKSRMGLTPKAYAETLMVEAPAAGDSNRSRFDERQGEGAQRDVALLGRHGYGAPGLDSAQLSWSLIDSSTPTPSNRESEVLPDACWSILPIDSAETMTLQDSISIKDRPFLLDGDEWDEFFSLPPESDMPLSSTDLSYDLNGSLLPLFDE